MLGELVFSVDGAAAAAATPVTLADIGLRERDHLQEWILAHPEVLGPDIMVVTSEFDRWVSARGEAQLDRLDILGLDRTGRLVVAELKRDRAPETMQMQSLNYAARVSRFNLDTLAAAYAAYVQKDTDQLLDPTEALAKLQEWAPEISDETLRTPRIVMVASMFPPSVTTTAVYLYENGIDITLIRFQAYRTKDGELLVTVSQLYPVPNAEDFTISPRTQAQRQVVQERQARASSVDRIIAAGALPVGAELRIAPPVGVGQNVEMITAWLDADPRRRIVTWTGDRRTPIQWQYDSESYNPTKLITKIIEESTQAPPQANVWGPGWVQDQQGRTLYNLGNLVGETASA